LQYSRARFYDAKLGRFISEDPIGFRGGDVNLFGYVGNNPQNFTDPSGLVKTHRDLQSFGFGDCSDLAKDIKVLEDSVADRSAELSYRKRIGLKFDDGHSGRLAGERRKLDELKRKYNSRGCGDDDDNPERVPVPVLIPAPKKENNDCKIRFNPMFQPTAFEAQLQADSFNQMGDFYETLVVGAAIGGAIYVAPGLIVAALPAVPRVLPQLAY
jgi:hypothetical protein